MILRTWLYLLVLSSSVQAQISDFEEIYFQKADSIAEIYKGESLDNLPLLAYNLTNNLPTEVEKFRAIYTWVSCNIESDYWATDKNLKKRKQFSKDSVALKEWDRSFQVKAFKKLKNEKKTVCTGYAYLIRELAALVDIDCEIIDGYGRTLTSNIVKVGIPNHSWNAVELDGNWYLCDATWSSGAYDITNDEFLWEYSEGYFLAEPELFVMNHYPLDTSWILMEEKPAFSTFLNAPLVYKGAFNYQLIPVAPSTMEIKAIKNESFTFLLKVADSLLLDDIEIELMIGSYKDSSKPEISRNEEGYLELKHVFKRQGTYDLHIKIEDKYIATYVVKVKKEK